MTCGYMNSQDSSLVKGYPYLRTLLGSFFFGILGAASSLPSLGYPRTPPLLPPPSSPSEAPSPQLAPSSESLKKLTLVALNDFHGRLDPETNTYGPHKVQVGGASTIASYFEIMKNSNPDGFAPFLVGDNSAGTLISSLSNWKAVARFFNMLPIVASAVGNHEFDNGQEKLRDFITASHHPYVATNVKGNLPGIMPYVLKTLTNGVNIGVIGLTTLESKEHAAPNIKGLKFENWADVTLKTARKLRSLGAHVVVVLAHGGGRCDMTQPPLKGNEACDLNNETGQLVTHLTSQPEPSVDVIFAGHTHFPQAHFVGSTPGAAGIPVLQNTAYGQSFSRVDLVVDIKKPVRFDTTNPVSRNTAVRQVNIHTPVFFCTEHFSNSPTCVLDETHPHLTKASVIKAPLVPATYEGKPIVPLKDVDRFMSYYREKASKVGKEPIVAAGVGNLQGQRTSESKMGQCVVDSLYEYSLMGAFRPVDGVILNSALLRGRFPEPGTMTMNHVFEMIPFPNTMVFVDLTLQEMELFLAELAGRPEETALISAPWKAVVRGSRDHTKATIIVPSGAQKKNRYTIATSSYILSALKNLKKFSSPAHRFLDTEVLLRDALANQFKHFDGSPGRIAPTSCNPLTAFRPRIDLMQITQNAL